MNNTIKLLNEGFLKKYDNTLTEAAQFPPVFKEISKCLEKHGYDVSSEAAVNYIWSVVDYMDYAKDADSSYTVEDWYKETKMNYPEDFDVLQRKMHESIGSAEWQNNLNAAKNYLKSHPYSIDSNTDVEDIAAEICENIFDCDYNNCSSDISHACFTAVQDYIDDELEDFESLEESIKNVLFRLNEKEMSPEDKRDSDLIRSVYNKIQKRSNAALTADEKAVMKKYGLSTGHGSIYAGDMYTGQTVASSHSITKPDVGIFTKNGYYGRGEDIKPEVNLADKARKVPQRRPYTDSVRYATVSFNSPSIDKHSNKYHRTFQDMERVKVNNDMHEPVHDMIIALSDRSRHKIQADKVDATYDKKIAELEKEREFEKSYHKRGLEDANSTINKLLNKQEGDK